jgi:hypothetical protein
MIVLFTGTDREKARAALNVEVEKASKKGTHVLRITDAHGVEDLRAAFQGSGMFGSSQIVILDGILGNEDMRAIFLEALPALAKSKELFLMLEGKLDADTRKRIEKYAESAKKFDAPGKGRDGSIFELSGALRRGDKKTLWVAYQRELSGAKAPEAIHGVLFWGAKDMLMKSKDEKSRERAKKLIAALAELPHKARRGGEDLEDALERFGLSSV